jgi:hypothetical protein
MCMVCCQDPTLNAGVTTGWSVLQGIHGGQRAFAALGLPERPAADTSGATVTISHRARVATSCASSSGCSHEKAEGRQQQEAATAAEGAKHAEGHAGRLWNACHRMAVPCIAYMSIAASPETGALWCLTYVISEVLWLIA